MDEEKERKERLIQLIKKFNHRCKVCGKVFLGAVIECYGEKSTHPIDILGISEYPLSCNKCPECAKLCYEEIYQYISDNGKLPPCSDDFESIHEFFEEENIQKVFTRDEIKKYLHEAHTSNCFDCYSYFDENYQSTLISYGMPIIAGELIDLYITFFDLLNDSLTKHPD